MKNDIKSRISLALLWIFSFIVIIFLISFTSFAEESPYFPMLQNENDTIPQSHIDIFNSYLDVENNYYFIYKGEQFSDGVGYFYVSMPKSYENAGIFGELNSNGYQFSLYLIGTANLTNGRISITYSGDVYHNVYQQWPFTNFQNLTSSKYDNNVSYVSNFKVYSTNTDLAQLVLAYGSDPTPPLDVGVAVIPPSFIVPEYLTGDSPPTNVPPSYIINNYTWTTAPSFDNSTVISGIQSIKDTLDWFADNIKNAISNLLSNIKGLAEYLGKTIQYYGNAIIETINNAIQNFYDNMSALVQPIFEKIAYITEPLDINSVSASFVSSNTYGIYDDFSSFFTTVDNVFNGVSEPDSLIIPIHLEQISTFYNFGIRSPVYLDLEQFENIRTPLRAFCWVFVSFGAIFLTENQLSMWLQGGSSSSSSTKGGG